MNTCIPELPELRILELSIDNYDNIEVKIFPSTSLSSGSSGMHVFINHSYKCVKLPVLPYVQDIGPMKS